MLPMTATYLIANNIGKVRLKIGDTDVSPATDAVFTDEEIGIFLTDQGNNINRASADALEAWAAKYGASPDSEKIGDYSYSQKIVDKLLALAKRLRDKEAGTPVLEWAEWDLSAGFDTPKKLVDSSAVIRVWGNSW